MALLKHVSLYTRSVSQGINPEVQLLSCRTCVDSQLYWVLPHCSPKELYQKKYSHHQCIRMPITLHRCHQSIVADSFIFAYLMGVKWYLVLICFPDSQGGRRTSFHLYWLGIHLYELQIFLFAFLLLCKWSLCVLCLGKLLNFSASHSWQ